MRKGSLFKLLTAATISSLYIFLFTVVQIVDVSADNTIPLELVIEEQTEQTTTTSETTRLSETLAPRTTIPLLSMAKPGIADYAPKSPTLLSSQSETTEEGEEQPDSEETEVPETEEPETEVPETKVPETEVPETEVPETEAPETEAPETEVPETEAPETEVPETEAPETEVPETEAPETEVPETEAPETEAPETEPSQPDDSDIDVPPESTEESSDESGTEGESSDESGTEGESSDEENEYKEEQLTVYDMVSGSYYTAGAREIVARAVVGEIWNEFPDEAVKAQAVATYTYIKKSNLNGRFPDTALKTDVYDRIYTLVDEVLGEAIYYNGELIQATFFASSCGYTNSSLNVWGVDYPYLRSVDCPFDEGSDPNWGSTSVYTSEEVKTRVYNTLGISLSGDPSQWFEIISRLDGREHGWITEMSVGGYTTANGRKIDGRTMREVVFSFGIKSSAFDLSYDSDSDCFTFTTYGHGHGVGMSQYGAKAMAEAGYTYKQILQHYFTGVEIY